MIRYICAITLLVPAGCAGAAIAAPSPVNQVLAAGLRAEARKDGPALLRAAEGLERLGAHPAEDTADLAAAWRQEALNLGATNSGKPWRGRTLGPAYRQGRVAAHSAFTTRQIFNAGQKAQVSVVATDGKMLNLTVRDDADKAACQLGVSGGEASCGWVPAWTGSYVIQLENAAPADVNFYLVTN